MTRVFTTLLIALTATLFVTERALAQQKKLRFIPEIEVDFWFDNREYKSDNSPDGTFYGIKLTPLVGIEWASKHRLMVGTDALVDFGDRPLSKKTDFIVYYNYNDDRFSAYAGVIPRKNLLGRYPLAMFEETIKYYDSNLEGLMIQYHRPRGYVELAFDWFSMIKDTRREKFILFSAGEIFTESRKFSFGYNASLLHYSISEVDDGVIDNLLAYPFVTFRVEKNMESRSSDKFKEKRRYSGLMVKAGWLQAMQRDRKNDDKFKTPGGFQLELQMERWGFGIYNTLYLGKNLLPYYAKYGKTLYFGDTFYQTNDVYNRLELFWNPIDNNKMRLRVSSIHHYDGNKLGWQQAITFSFLLNRKILGL